jgi:undecaprenyl-diphosphatase
MLNTILAIDTFLLMKINQAWTGEWADQFFPAVTDLHKSKYFFSIAVPLIFLLFYRKYAKKAFVLFFSLLICLGFNDFLSTHTTKNVFERARPAKSSKVTFVVQERSPSSGFSFVSNHSSNMFCFALFCSYFIGYTSIFYTIACLIGYSRIYNGAHFPSDVLAGALFGTVVALIFVSVLNRTYLRGQK